VWRASNQYMAAFMRKMGKPNAKMEERAQRDQGVLVEDICSDDQLVQWWMWFPLLVIMIIMFCVVLGVQFDLPVGMSILSLFLAFFFSFLAVQCAGVTDITPLTAASKASQIVLGGATKGEGWTIHHAQRQNLLGGSLASMGAGQASDLVSDFRTGFLLRTSPKQQWLAQGIGTIVSVFMAPALFILFTKAYPCVIAADAPPDCAFPGPSIAAWQAVAVAVTEKTFPVPRTSGIFAIVLSVFGAAMVLFRHYFYRGRFEKYRIYHPNMMTIGLAFVLPQTIYGTAMLIGSTVAYVWAKRSPRKFDIYGYAVAAGMIAGEGIGGFINAIFQIANIAGPTPYGTNVACPADAC